jgi:exonuclease SbcC
MIQELSIQNFQSHKNTRLLFDPGVNVIVGTTDSGKTAILRGLRLAINNKPSGQAYCSRWMGKGDTSKVVVTTMEGNVITRQEKPEKLYKLNETEFKAFGTEVPEEIKNVLNLGEVNDQAQMNMPFLISNSAGEVASHFNKVARLDKIDTATANINSWIRELTSDIKYKTNQKKELEEKVKDFQYLEKFEVQVEVLEEMEAGKSTLFSNIKKVYSLISKMKEQDLLLEKEKEKIKIEPLLNVIFSTISKKKELEQNRGKLHRCISQVQNTITELEEQQNVLLIEKPLIKIIDQKALLAKIESEEINLKKLVWYIGKLQTRIDTQNNIISIENPVKDLLTLFESKNTHLSAFSTLNKAVLALSNTFTLLAKKQAEFTAISKAFDLAMPDICPLCGK